MAALFRLIKCMYEPEDEGRVKRATRFVKKIGLRILVLKRQAATRAGHLSGGAHGLGASSPARVVRSRVRSSCLNAIPEV